MNSFEKLQVKLSELFELDQADLDFGIYRIMNMRRDEIKCFIKNDLLSQVQEAFKLYDTGERKRLEEELKTAKEGAVAAGIEIIEEAPKVKEIQAKLDAAVDFTSLENEVYDHLYQFFSRYYDEGDFISQRRYKKDVYALPYNGEEVKLHWANADQYYIKTTEYFHDYTFKVDGKTVHFKIVEADTEKDNVKDNNKDRRFMLVPDTTVAEEDDELVIRFVYQTDETKRKQDKINEETVESINEALSPALASWIPLLDRKWTRADGSESDSTVLKKHLHDYTSKNTFDYFIHKDLRGFLRRELDFYIKNEVMFLDDIEDSSAPRAEQYLSKIKVIRLIAHKIIDFLSQIENFQKKLWLKKKFVTETNYCITLDRVHEDLYPEIAANEAQREEWVRLFSIDELKGDLTTPGYSVPLTVDFLKANNKLVLDTAFFEEDFKDRLLASIDDFDEQCDGLLIHSENFQALNLLQERYREQVKCVSFDPPYNTGDDGFVYKDSYQSSSWSSMMNQVVQNLYGFLQQDGSLFANCDENEFLNFGHILQSVFGKKNHVETITWNKRVPKNDKGIGNIHEYIYLFAKNQKERRANERDYVMRKDGLEEIYEIVKKEKSKGSGLVTAQKALKKFYKKQGFDRGITLYCELDPNFEVFGKINMSWPNAKTEGPRYEVINPATGKPAPIPDRGWRWKEETFRKAEQDGPVFELPDGSIIKGRIWYSPKENIQPSSITYLKEVESFLLRSIISLKSDGSIQLENLGLGGLIDYPKPVKLSEWIFYSTEEKSGSFIDCFAGSGTAAHGLLSLNREYPGDRKYILVDMDHFDSVMKPRIAKVVYSKDWNNGKPTARETGVSHCFKYIRLESYEDTLNNIELNRTPDQQTVLNSSPRFKEEYMLGYMIDVESRGSQSLLNIDNFDDPWSYSLKVGTGSAAQTKPVNVDLPETFNYLIGLKIKRRVKKEGYLVIEGENLHGEKILVIWRKVRELSVTDPDEIKQAYDESNTKLEDFFKSQGYNKPDSEFDLIYVNGDNNLMNVPLEPEAEGGEPPYRVKLIEAEFKQRMFNVEDV